MFIKYQHVERRFDIKETLGILDTDYVILQPKLDGSNCSMWYAGDEIHIASRNRELSLQSDNAGCYNTLIHDMRYHNFFDKYPYARLYGEWLVQHHIKYKEDAYKKFYVFEAYNSDELMHIECLKLYDIDVIEGICVSPKELKEKIADGSVFEYYKEVGNYLIDSGTPQFEGFVVKNFNWQNEFGRQTWVKIINDNAFNGNKPKKERVYIDKSLTKESLFIDSIDNQLFYKEFEKTVKNGEFSSKDIGTYIKNCQQAAFDDYIKDHILKEHIADWNYKASQQFTANRSIKLLKEKGIL